MKTKPILFVALICLFSILFSGFDQSKTASGMESEASKVLSTSVDALFNDVSCNYPPPSGPLFVTTEVEYPYSVFKVGDKAVFPPFNTPLNGLYQVYSGFGNVWATFKFVNGVAVSTAEPC